MIPIRVAPALWSTSIMPQGLLQEWRCPEGALVRAGDPVACVQIEDSRHELTAPASGRLKIELPPNSVIEPGMVIGHLSAP
jgi:hypothetical protein